MKTIGCNKKLIDKLFEIISKDDTLKKFLDYKNNEEYFSINGEKIDIGEYLMQLGKIFGNKDKFGNFSNKNAISQNFFIPELDQFKTRYSQIFEQINIDRYVNPTYEFRSFTTLDRISNTVIRKDEEPDWEINEELRDSIIGKMPSNLSLEEKAIYIYCKLCKELTYDDGYLFRGKLENGRYEYKFSKEHMENIKPHSKITCWDYSRLYSKFVNSLDGNIEAVIIAEGANHGHYLTGFYTDRASVMLEAINGRTGGTNDLMKAKNGIEFEGVEIISDRDGVIKQAIEKIYPQIFGKKQKSIKNYIQDLKSTASKENPINLKYKIQSFTDEMKKCQIFGNEAVQTLSAFNKAGFFGQDLTRAYLGKKEISQDGKKFYRRLVLIKAQNESSNSKEELYLLDSESLELSQCTSQEIIRKLNSGEFVYENEKHKIQGIDMEVTDDDTVK